MFESMDEVKVFVLRCVNGWVGKMVVVEGVCGSISYEWWDVKIEKC